MIVSYIEKHYSDDVDTTTDIVVRGGTTESIVRRSKKQGELPRLFIT